MARRIAAIVLPLLACELVRQRLAPGAPDEMPLAVILEEGAGSATEIAATAVLDVVDDDARRYGVRPGQKVTEAAALVAGLSIHRVTHAELDAALGRIAEVAMSLGTTAAIRLADHGKGEERHELGDAPFDTVWLDVTGVAHLVGGEAALLDEIAERAGAFGHRVRVAIADGPRLAQALARWRGKAIAPEGGGAQAIADLPVHALVGLGRPARAAASRAAGDLARWFVRLGVLTVGDLARLPRAALSSRLGERAAGVTAIVSGHDATPLVPCVPPRVLVEEVSFEEGVSNVESLLFVLRGMTSRVAARLAARGEATTELEVTIAYDRSIALLRRGERDERDQPATAEDLALRFGVELPAPLSREADLLRALKAKLERLELAAPAVAVRLSLPQITRSPRVQLDLSRDAAVSPDALPALLAELSAEIGPERVGVLSVVDAHRPEARSRLVAPSLGSGGAPPSLRSWGAPPSTPPGAPPGTPPEALPGVSSVTRLLVDPVPIGRLEPGAVIAVDQHLYAIERARFVMRLDAVEWWTAAPASRDYSRVFLASGGAPTAAGAVRSSTTAIGGDAWVYTERATGEAYLQGWCE